MINIREDFCGICAALPIALAGNLGAASTITSAFADGKHRKVIIIILCAVSLVISIYLLIKYWGCSQCK